MSDDKKIESNQNKLENSDEEDAEVQLNSFDEVPPEKMKKKLKKTPQEEELKEEGFLEKIFGIFKKNNGSSKKNADHK